MRVATRMKTIRCSPEELEAWTKAAGGNLNGWIRTSLNQHVEYEAALRRVEEGEKDFVTPGDSA